MHKQTVSVPDRKAFILRVIGFISSLLLTILTYVIMVKHSAFNMTASVAVAIILVLAFMQATVQVLFFLDIWQEKGLLWNIAVFISTVSIVFVVVYFSIWIMGHLNYNMMPNM